MSGTVDTVLISEIFERTPFKATKTAEEDVQFAIDPSFGLTKERYAWYSNGTIFDNTFFTDGQGRINISTGANSGDIARIRSAFSGQYQSHSLAEPGLGLSIAPNNTILDPDNLVSLDHGEITLGAFTWDEVNDVVSTGIAIQIDTNGARVILKSDETQQSNSPVPQADWNIDAMDSKGPSDFTFEPSRGFIYNFPYTWYNQGALFVAVLDNQSNQIIPIHRFSVDQVPSISTPNLPIQAVVDNDGTATSTTANLGGMQYTLYGIRDVETQSRSTPELVQNSAGDISDTAVTTNNAIDPEAQPGFPQLAVQRDEAEFESDVLEIRLDRVFGNATSDTYIFVWDEWNPGTALTGESFTEPESINVSTETRILTDTQATDYTPTEAVVRDVLFVTSGKQQAVSISESSINNRIPLKATQVMTSVIAPGENNTEYQPFRAVYLEGF